MSINVFKKHPGNKITFGDPPVLCGERKVVGSRPKVIFCVVVPGSELLFCRSQSLTPHPAVPRLETNYAESNGPVLISSATAGMPGSARQFARQRGRATPASDKTRNLLADRCIYRTTQTPCYRCNKAGRSGGRQSGAGATAERCSSRGGTRPSRQCRRPTVRPTGAFR